VETTDLTQN